MSEEKPTVQDFVDAQIQGDVGRAEVLFRALTGEAEQTGDKDALHMRMALWAGSGAALLQMLRERAEGRSVTRSDLEWALKTIRLNTERLQKLHDTMPEEIVH